MLLHDCFLVKRLCTCSVYESGDVQTVVDVEILSCCPLAKRSKPNGLVSDCTVHVMCDSVSGLFVAAMVEQTLILI